MLFLFNKILKLMLKQLQNFKLNFLFNTTTSINLKNKNKRIKKLKIKY